VSRQQRRSTTAPKAKEPTEILPLQKVTQPLAKLSTALADVQRPIIAEFEQLLASIAGKRFETFDEAVAAIDAIKAFTRSAGIKLCYNGQPVSLYVTQAARATRSSSIEVRKFTHSHHCEYLHTGPVIPTLACKPMSSSS
jgi:hypothetical protein